MEEVHLFLSGGGEGVQYCSMEEAHLFLSGGGEGILLYGGGKRHHLLHQSPPLLGAREEGVIKWR